MFTLHPRTRTQMYSGSACWDEIARVKEALDIPVVGNGDIRTADDVVRMRRETGCDGIMIARGSFGNPWIFQQARTLLNGAVPRPTPRAAERFAVALRHAELQIAVQGDSPRTAREFRKHLGWYTRGLPGAAALREQLHRVESMAEVESTFREYLRPHKAVG
jgi:tRNA-dihydrouridine synthase